MPAPKRSGKYDPASYEALEAWKAAGQDSRTPILDMKQAEQEARRRNGGTLPKPRDEIGTPEVRKEVREKSGWSVQDVSNATGVPADTIARYEDGRADPAESILATVYRSWLRSMAVAIDSGQKDLDSVDEYVGQESYQWDPSVSAEVNVARRERR